MNIQYLPVDFKIRFAVPALVDNNPAFILRGLLGNNLRSLCCMNKGFLCPDCIYNKNCLYAEFFESIIEKDAAPVPGSDRTSHPFAITSCDTPEMWTEIQEFNFTITLFGKYTECLPYVYSAILRAGKKGMFRNRIPFEITQAYVNGNSIILDDENIDLNQKALVFDDTEFNSAGGNKRIKIDLITPFRFKINGVYARDFTALDFMKCLHRRYVTMMKIYGGYKDEDFIHFTQTDLCIENKSFYWKSIYRYSGRQKKTMQFGGVYGSFELTGNFTAYEIMLLEFGRIANGGKNTNFSLGQLSCHSEL